MFSKLLLIIVVMGATACALLVNRQQRIETAHEMVQLHQRLLQHQQMLWTLRCEVAVRCQPDQVRQSIAQLGGSWSPIRIQPVPRAAMSTQLASRQDAPVIDPDWGG